MKYDNLLIKDDHRLNIDISLLPTSTKWIQKCLKDLGIIPNRKLGQNFLLNNNIQHQIVNYARLTSQDVVLEIGAGLGHLTQFLIGKVKTIWTAEIDSRLAEFVTQRFGNFPGLQVLNLDALANKHHLNPILLATIQQAIQSSPFKVLANLPYSIATPVVINLLELAWRPSLMIITVQKEVAQRLTAQPGSPQYGYLSIHTHLYANASVISTISSREFYPRPQVESAIVEITPIPERSEILNKPLMINLVKTAFQMRRKTLWNTLRRSAILNRNTEALKKALEKSDISPDCRAETISLERFITLANTIHQMENFELWAKK